MSVQIMGLKSINGPLVVLDNAREVHYDELAELILEDGSRRTGRVIQIEGQRAVLQVFEGTNGLSLDNVRTRLTGRPMELPVSSELLGRIFSGAGR